MSQNLPSLIKPKTIELPDVDGDMHKFTISRIPYLPLGREIALSGVLSTLPKVGDYKISEDIAYRMFKLIEVIKLDDNGEEMDPIRLHTPALVSNHVRDSVLGARLEMAMIAYNYDFFGQGGISGFLVDSARKHLPLILSTLIPLLPPSLQQEFADGLNSVKSST